MKYPVIPDEKKQTKNITSKNRDMCFFGPVSLYKALSSSTILSICCVIKWFWMIAIFWNISSAVVFGVPKSTANSWLIYTVGRVRAKIEDKMSTIDLKTLPSSANHFGLNSSLQEEVYVSLSVPKLIIWGATLQAFTKPPSLQKRELTLFFTLLNKHLLVSPVHFLCYNCGSAGIIVPSKLLSFNRT